MATIQRKKMVHPKKSSFVWLSFPFVAGVCQGATQRVGNWVNTLLGCPTRFQTMSENNKTKINFNRRPSTSPPKCQISSLNTLFFSSTISIKIIAFFSAWNQNRKILIKKHFIYFSCAHIFHFFVDCCWAIFCFDCCGRLYLIACIVCVINEWMWSTVKVGVR